MTDRQLLISTCSFHAYINTWNRSQFFVNTNFRSSLLFCNHLGTEIVRPFMPCPTAARLRGAPTTCSDPPPLVVAESLPSFWVRNYSMSCLVCIAAVTTGVSCSCMLLSGNSAGEGQGKEGTILHSVGAYSPTTTMADDIAEKAPG